MSEPRGQRIKFFDKEGAEYSVPAERTVLVRNGLLVVVLVAETLRANLLYGTEEAARASFDAAVTALGSGHTVVQLHRGVRVEVPKESPAGLRLVPGQGPGVAPAPELEAAPAPEPGP